MQLKTHEPDHLYCVYCHALAIGPCATCRAMICGDCAEITGGGVAKVAVCKKCFKTGHGNVTRRAWWWTLRLPLGLVGGVALLGVLLRACS